MREVALVDPGYLAAGQLRWYHQFTLRTQADAGQPARHCSLIRNFFQDTLTHVVQSKSPDLSF